MRVRCEHCGIDMEVPYGTVGKTVKCPECSDTFTCRLPQAIVMDGAPPEVEQPAELVLQDEVQDEPMALTDEVEKPSPEQQFAGTVGADQALSAFGTASPAPVIRRNPRQWYVMINGVAAVALTYKELQQRAKLGEIRPNDDLYFAPDDLHVKAVDVQALFSEEVVRGYEAKRNRFRRLLPWRKKDAPVVGTRGTPAPGKTGKPAEGPLPIKAEPESPRPAAPVSAPASPAETDVQVSQPAAGGDADELLSALDSLSGGAKQEGKAQSAAKTKAAPPDASAESKPQGGASDMDALADALGQMQREDKKNK